LCVETGAARFCTEYLQHLVAARSSGRC
jgi:hypothetical protein